MLTPEQKAELRRQCDLEGCKRFPEQLSTYLNDKEIFERFNFEQRKRQELWSECLMSERLRVQPLIEAGSEQQTAFSELAAFASANLPERKLEEFVKYWAGVKERRAWIAALTAYQNTER